MKLIAALLMLTVLLPATAEAKRRWKNDCRKCRRHCLTRDLNDAEKVLKEKYEKIKKEWEATNPLYELRPTCVYRTPEEQWQVYVKKLSKIDGRTNLSNHNYKPARAIDVGIFIRSNGAYIDSQLKKGIFREKTLVKLYTSFGEMAEREGLVWGGRWKSLNDVYHIELRPKDVPLVVSPNEKNCTGGAK